MEELRQFIGRHRLYVAYLSPVEEDLQGAVDLSEAILLIQLALHCDQVSAEVVFMPTPLFFDGLLASRLTDADLAQVVPLLLQVGMGSNIHLLERLRRVRPDCVQTYMLIEHWHDEEDIKEPEGC